MHSVDQLRDALPDFAKDIRLNLSSVLKEDSTAGLKINQVHGIALACAYATKDNTLIAAIAGETAGTLSDAEKNAAQSAATIMAMNNVYYRFLHLVSDKEFGKMPAGLRMNVIGQPGIDKIDFELYSLAISAINGCGMCMDAHVNQVLPHGISKAGVQQSIKIASVINAAAQALAITRQPQLAQAA